MTEQERFTEMRARFIALTGDAARLLAEVSTWESEILAKEQSGSGDIFYSSAGLHAAFVVRLSLAISELVRAK